MKIKVLIGIVVILLFIILIVLRFLPTTRYPLVADASAVATAEYIRNNPISIPMFISSITPNIGSFITASQRICITLLYDAQLVDTDRNDYGNLTNLIYTNIQLYVDNTLVPTSDFEVAIPFSIDIYNAANSVQLCKLLSVGTGLHLLELRGTVTSTGIFGDGNTQSYMWFYEVAP